MEAQRWWLNRLPPECPTPGPRIPSALTSVQVPTLKAGTQKTCSFHCQSPCRSPGGAGTGGPPSYSAEARPQSHRGTMPSATPSVGRALGGGLPRPGGGLVHRGHSTGTANCLPGVASHTIGPRLLAQFPLQRQVATSQPRPSPTLPSTPPNAEGRGVRAVH